MYDFCAVSFDDDVLNLIFPGAVSTPVDDGPYFFNDGSWLVNLRGTMVSLSDWRESFHFISFVPVELAVSIFQWKLSSSVHQKYVFWSNNILCESRGMLECSVFVPNMHSCHAGYNSICSEGSALQCIFILTL